MKVNETKFALDCDNYRQKNGSISLSTWMGDGKIWVVKKQTDAEIVLHAVDSEEEIVLAPEEFHQRFMMAIIDEVVFWTGSEQQQADARKQVEAEQAAVMRCLYGKENLPAII